MTCLTTLPYSSISCPCSFRRISGIENFLLLPALMLLWLLLLLLFMDAPVPAAIAAKTACLCAAIAAAVWLNAALADKMAATDADADGFFI